MFNPHFEKNNWNIASKHSFSNFHVPVKIIFRPGSGQTLKKQQNYKHNKTNGKTKKQ